MNIFISNRNPRTFPIIRPFVWQPKANNALKPGAVHGSHAAAFKLISVF